MSIPKIIHYCWVGGKPKPQSVLYCIESWKRCCPDYEIREWNESNYDFTKNEYMRQAYEAKKWGFERYEVSNFAKDGLISRHNFGYWTREEYLGLGAGAYSLVKTEDGSKKLDKEKSFANVKDVNQYIEYIENAQKFDDIDKDDVEYLCDKDVRNEAIMLSLRTTRGVESNLLTIPDNLKNFFEEADGFTRLNARGMAVMNSILAEILDI